MTSGQPHASRFTVELKQAAEQQGKLTFQAEARRGAVLQQRQQWQQQQQQ
ncbi:hypothetical protein [Pantoea sp. AV62]|nr:hypothetical protein [Pantoea sp. AV62]